MHWFLPVHNNLPYLDQNLVPVAVAPAQNLGSRLVDVVSNTSKICTSERHIVEQSFSRVWQMKLSGNQCPLPHQLTMASGVQPTPELPVISIWLDVMCVFRREGKPFNLKYELAPGVSYSDHGRDLLFRLTKENVLCSTKALVFNRLNPFALVTDRELRNGSVTQADLLVANQTTLPALTREELMGITLGPFSVDRSHGYWTGYNEADTLAVNQGNYVNPDHYHQQASQVRGAGGG